MGLTGGITGKNIIGRIKSENLPYFNVSITLCVQLKRIPTARLINIAKTTETILED